MLPGACAQALFFRLLRRLYFSPMAAFMAVMMASETLRFWSSVILAGERSKSTGDSSILLIMVPSENPASTRRITPSLVKVGVF